MTRKKQTGEPTNNGGHFASKARSESSTPLSQEAESAVVPVTATHVSKALKAAGFPRSQKTTGMVRGYHSYSYGYTASGSTVVAESGRATSAGNDKAIDLSRRMEKALVEQGYVVERRGTKNTSAREMEFTIVGRKV